MESADPSPERKKLLDRLVALLALANDKGAFAAEAATARAKADELIARYNLSLTEGSKERGRLEIETWRPWAKGAQWEYKIAEAVGKLCGCEVYWVGDLDKFEWLRAAGTVANLEALRYLLGAVNTQRMGAWIKHKAEGGSSKFYSFCFSFASALEERIDILLVGAAVIIAERMRAKLWFEGTREIQHETLIKGRGTSNAGREAGASASLARGQVNNGGALLRLDFKK